MKRRIISMVMVLVLVFTMLPVYAIADGDGTGDAGTDLQSVIDTVKDLINGGDTSGKLGEIIKNLDYEQLAKLFGELIKDKIDIAPVLDKIDVTAIAAVVKDLVAGNIDIGQIVDGMDAEQIAELIKTLAGDNDAINAVLDKLDVEQLAAVIKALVSGDADISDVIAGLDTDKIVEVIKGLVGDNKAIVEILGKLDTDRLVAVIKGLIAGDVDISDIVAGLDTDKIVEVIKGLVGDNETIAEILGKLDTDQLIAVIKALVAGDIDISDVVAGLDVDKIIEIIKGLGDDNETIRAILDKVDVDKLVEIIKGLIDGGVDVGDILKNLDPYTLLKVISGLFGNDLDVTGPNNVTVTETETATFSVKVKLSLLEQLQGVSYKYMWLEPDTLKDLNSDNFEKLDVLTLITRLLGSSLGNGETLNIANTTMRDDGRSFVCVIYSISDKVFYVTDKATLTVTPFSDCTHNSLKFVRGIDATCTEAGNVAYYECPTCGKLFLDKDCNTQTNANDVVIPAKGHTPVETKAAVEATCTATGLTAELTCSVCREVVEHQKVVPMKAHTPVEGTPAVAPTCTTDGSTAQTICSVCKTELVAAEVIPASGHTKVVDIEAVEPTCTKDGRTEGSHCSTCNEVLSKSEPVKAKGHNFVGIKCSECGEFVPFPFVDVPETAWYRGNVEYVWQHELMVGVSADKFAPDATMTRAMFALVLYRIAGEPSVEGMRVPFTDISSRHWAYDAVVWAYNKGVTDGVSTTEFAPDANITRAQLVTMLFRYEKASPAASGALNFTDASSIASWARDAVLWAYLSGIVSGYPDGSFGPDRTATRAEMAAILQRYCQLKQI